MDQFGGETTDAECEQLDRIEVHPFAQGIAHLQKTNDLVGKRLNDGYLEPKPEIPHLRGERLAFVEQDFVTCRQRLQTLQQRRRSLRLAQLFGGSAGWPPVHRAEDRRG